MAAENLIKEIKKIRVAATYAKKRHFNASDRKRCAHHFLTYSVLLLNIVTGSVLFGVMKEQIWEHLPALFATVSAILIGTSEYFKFGKHSTEHAGIADRYLRLMRACDSALASYSDGHIQESNLRERFADLQMTLSETDTSANAYPTNRKDYEKSRQGVKDGEEKYTRDELNELE